MIITLISSTRANAQDTQNVFDYWLEQFNTGYSFLEKEDYSNALIHFNKSYEVMDQIDFSTTIETQLYPVDNAYYIGFCHFSMLQYEASINYFQKAIDIVKTVEGDYEAFILESLDYLAFAYVNIDVKKAHDIRLEIIERLNKIEAINDFYYAQMLFNLTFSYRNISDNLNFYKTLIEVEQILSTLGEVKNDYYAFVAYYLGHYYFDRDDFINASKFYAIAEDLKDYIEGQEGIDIPEMIYLNGVSYFKQNNFKKAEEKIKTIVNHPKIKNEDHINLYVQAIDALGQTLYRLSKFEEAENTYKEGFSFVINTVGNAHKAHAEMLLNVGKFYIDFEDYKNSLTYTKMAYDSFVKIEDTNSSAYIITLNNLGLCYYFNGNYELAKRYYKEAFLKTKESNNNNDLNSSNIEGNLALIYQHSGDFDKAKEILERLINEKREILGELDPFYAIALMNYGNFLSEIGEYFLAEKNYLEAIAIYKKTTGTSNLAYAKQLVNIGQFYLTTRQIKKALEIYNEAIDIYEKNNKYNSLNMALALIGKGVVLQSLGDIDGAVKVQNESLIILENTVGKKHMDYGKAAHNLGLTYQLKQEFMKAIDYYNLAFETYRFTFKDGHFIYGRLLSNYAELFFSIEDYEKTHHYLDIVLKNFEINYGKESYMYTTAVFQKGVTFLKQRNLQAALKLFDELKPVMLKTIDKDSDIYNSLLFNLAVTNDLLGKSSIANDYYNQYNEGLISQLQEIFRYRSEDEKRDFLKRFKISIDWLNSSIFNKTINNESLIGLGINNQLILKGLLLNASKDILSDLSKLNIATTNEKIDQYRALKKLKTTKLSQNEISSLETIEEKLNQLESELIKLHDAAYETSEHNFKKNWLDLRNSLKPNELVIDFVSYQNRSADVLTDTLYYGAYLIHKDWEQPKVIELFKESELKTILKSKNPNTLYATRGSKANSTATTVGLYQLLWAPLEPYLENIETIYYSPSGLLNQIPFAALDTEDKPILASQYNLVQLSSTFSLTKERKTPKTDNTLFIGGINYEYKSSKPIEELENTANSLSSLKGVSGTRGMGSTWNYLPGTLTEIETIQQQFSEKNKTYTVLSDKQATETAFKKLSGDSPTVIHIATHGFFFENPKKTNTDMLKVNEQNIYTVAQDPLLRSGLLFAGANYAWQHGANPYKEDDGVLTALEISNLDLNKTDVVILSACETGLGDIDGSEGVYGLQRAFKMAGVDTIIMSLWEVPDAETSEFMTLFYSYWLNGQSLRDAFRKTQLKMAETYKNTPEKWAAFVLLE